MVLYTTEEDGEQYFNGCDFTKFVSLKDLLEFLKDNENILGVHAIDESDCWLKLSSIKYSVKKGLEAEAGELRIHKPGVHPGGDMYWITPTTTVYAPVYVNEEGDYPGINYDDWFFLDREGNVGSKKRMAKLFSCLGKTGICMLDRGVDLLTSDAMISEQCHWCVDDPWKNLDFSRSSFWVYGGLLDKDFFEPIRSVDELIHKFYLKDSEGSLTIQKLERFCRCY